MGIQETKLCDILDPIIGHLFRSQNVGFAFSPSVDSARGLLCCWDYARFHESSRSCHPTFVAITRSWIVESGPKGLICIYASNTIAKRVEFFSFSDLVHLYLGLEGLHYFWTLHLGLTWG